MPLFVSLTWHTFWTNQFFTSHPVVVLQDVFTVSVGNLPPKASVLIKITYVAELQTDGELIHFALPASVAPWDKDPALSQQTQVSDTAL